MNDNKWFLSSTGSGDLSLTIKGLLTGLVPAVLLILKLKGIEASQDQLMEFIDAIVSVVVAATTLVSVGMTLVGLARKLYIKYFEK